MQVILNMQLPAQIKKKKKWYVARCPVLDVYAQGETQKKALNNLIEALRLFLVSCIERGTLDEVLKSCGFKLSEKEINAQKPFPKKYTSIQIPISYKTPAIGCQTHCHA